MERLVEVKQVDNGPQPVQGDRARTPISAQAEVATGGPTEAGRALADRPTTSEGGITPNGGATPDGATDADSRSSPESGVSSDSATTVEAVATAEAVTDDAGGRDEGMAPDATPDSRPPLAQAPDSAKAVARDGKLPAADQWRDRASVDGGDGEGLADDPYYLAEVGFWDRVVELEELWQGHVARWPEGPRGSGADRVYPDDPPGSWRGDGGRFLSPEENAEANRLIAGLREPEEAVTGLLQGIEQESKFGGHLVGLDYRLKGDERLKEKIVDAMENEVGASIADATGEIHDAVRYTFCFDKETYADGYRDVHERLVSAGYQMPYRLNHWLENPQYKGINSRWQSPDGGRFELQFHTKESFYAKEHLTHRSYERLRSPETSWEESPDLEAYQVAVSAAIPKPAGVAEIPSIRKANG